MPPTPTPLATYHERVLRGTAFQRRDFLLFPDRLDIHLRWRTSATDLSLPLADFRPVPPVPGRTRLTIYKRATLASLLGLLAIVLLLLLDSNLPAAPHAHFHRPLMVAVTAVAILLALALLVANRFRKPVELLKFLNTEGQVALDILKSGPETQNFQKFTTRLQTQIRHANK